MSKFSRNDSPIAPGSAGVRKKSKLLKYEHIIYHFKARDLENSVNIIFSKIFKFRENTSKTNFAKFLKVLIKSQNLNISRK